MATFTNRLLAAIVVFVITIGVPAFGKLYVDYRDARVMQEIKVLQVKVDLILDRLNILRPSSN